MSHVTAVVDRIPGPSEAAVIQDFSAYLYEVIVMRRADP